jgi:thioredoxin reductase
MAADPKVMLETMREQVAAYPTVSFIADAAVDAFKVNGAILVALRSGAIVTGKRLLLAFGISDILPETPGLAERWGRSVIHCPYCHGYEFSGRPLGVLNVSSMSPHQAVLISEWGPTTFYLDGGDLDAAETEALVQRGIRIEAETVERLTGEGRSLSELHLAGNRSDRLDALFIGPCNHLNSATAEQMGCAIETGPLGQTVKVDETQMTSVPDVYAAGDITRVAHNVTFACADGVMAAIAIHRSLMLEATV